MSFICVNSLTLVFAFLFRNIEKGVTHLKGSPRTRFNWNHIPQNLMYSISSKKVLDNLENVDPDDKMLLSSTVHCQTKKPHNHELREVAC